MTKKYSNRKEEKMLSRKKRIKQMTFQNQERRVEPIPDEHKYMISLMRHQKELIGKSDENIRRFTGRSSRPQYI